VYSPTELAPFARAGHRARAVTYHAVAVQFAHLKQLLKPGFHLIGSIEGTNQAPFKLWGN
jgi:hypothetical protein